MDHQIDFTMPWTDHLYERNRALRGTRWWAYGIQANRKTVDTFLRYTYEQGLSQTRFTIEDIFTPELFDT